MVIDGTAENGSAELRVEDLIRGDTCAHDRLMSIVVDLVSRDMDQQTEDGLSRFPSCFFCFAPDGCASR